MKQIREKPYGRCDRIFLIGVVLLATLGAVAVFSAGYAYGAFRYSDANYFIKKQTVWLLLGLAVMTVSSGVSERLLRAAVPYP